VNEQGVSFARQFLFAGSDPAYASGFEPTDRKVRLFVALGRGFVVTNRPSAVTF
jgi:hypothetical protein